MLRCITGSSGAEGSSPGRLTSSLEHSMPNTPMPVVIPSVQPVPHKHQGVGSSDNHRMHRCLGIGSTGATDFFTVSSILVPWTEEVSGRNHRRGGPSGLAMPIFSLSSLEPKSLRMTTNHISLSVVLSFDHQNHSKWHRWCHVRYKLLMGLGGLFISLA